VQKYDFPFSVSSVGELFINNVINNADCQEIMGLVVSSFGFSVFGFSVSSLSIIKKCIFADSKCGLEKDPKKCKKHSKILIV